MGKGEGRASSYFALILLDTVLYTEYIHIDLQCMGERLL